MRTTYCGGENMYISDEDSQQFNTFNRKNTSLKNGLVSFYNFDCVNNLGKDDYSTKNFSLVGTGYNFIKNKNFNLVNLESAYLTINEYLLPGTGDKSISIFFKIYQPLTFTDYKTLIGMYKNSMGGSSFNSYINYNLDGTLSITCNISANMQSFPLSSPSQLNHIVYSGDSSSKNIYLNGELISSQETSLLGSTNLGSSPTTSIGYDLSHGQLNCTIGLTGFWNRALTLMEVKALYNNGRGLKYPFI
jgi:hypothetical protein